jgi:hypothetical protein
MGEAAAPRNRWRAHCFAVGVLVPMVVYVAFALSPSSYGAIFDELGVERAGLVAGVPRPIRGDEFRRWTPFMHIAMNNDFRRINETSVFREDLRNVEGLPLADWGLAFKPSFWAFFVADPAHAFSFHHAFWIAACLIGYERLFRALRMRPAVAALGSTLLFLSAFFQTWWTTYGPVVGGFPWLVLACLAPMHAALRVAVAAWVTVTWALASLYPPIEVTCAFVAGVMLLAWRRDAFTLRRLVPFASGVAIGVAVAFVYYREVFATMATTVYPGLRRAGGGGAPFEQWVSHWMPTFVIRGDEGLVNENVCEAATVGSFLPLLLLCFVDWRDFGGRLREAGAQGRALRIEIGVLLAGVVLTSLWLLAPVPSPLGMPFLWHLVPAKRMWFAGGLLILLLAFGVLRHARLRLEWPRVAALAAAVIALRWASQRVLGNAPLLDHATIGLLASVALLVALRARLAAAAAPALVACAALANALAFGGFNPLQSAKPIFDPPAIPLRASLDRLVARHERDWLVVHGSDGVWPNAFGYRSVSHVLYAPALDWFRPRFPELPEAEFANLFNRTLYTFLSPRTVPFLLGDAAISVPIDVFDPPTIATRVGGAPSGAVREGGAIDGVSAFVESGAVHVIVQGWAPMDGSDPDATLHVLTRLPVTDAVAYPSVRGDVARTFGDPRLALSGFEMRLTLATPPAALTRPPVSLEREPLCIVADAPGWGRTRVRGRFAAAGCPER